MPNSQHLLLRKGTWYYRRRVPKAFQAEHGPIIQRSLGTSDKKEAIKKRELLDVEWRQRFDGDQAPCAINCTTTNAKKVLTESQAEQLARQFVATSDARRRRVQEARPFQTSLERAETIERFALDLAVAEGSRRHDCGEHVDRTIRRLLDDDHFDIDDDVYSGVSFATLVRRGLLPVSWTPRLGVFMRREVADATTEVRA